MVYSSACPRTPGCYYNLPILPIRERKFDRKWVWADAKIVGSSVVSSHPEVPQPVAVRYAFSMNPEGANLYNQDGLPASPFRTDDW
jgi:hypothetical protein